MRWAITRGNIHPKEEETQCGGTVMSCDTAKHQSGDLMAQTRRVSSSWMPGWGWDLLCPRRFPSETLPTVAVARSEAGAGGWAGVGKTEYEDQEVSLVTPRHPCHELDRSVAAAERPRTEGSNRSPAPTTTTIFTFLSHQVCKCTRADGRCHADPLR